MHRVLSERDITVSEGCHQLYGLPLHESNITIVSASLESGRHIRRYAETDSLILSNNMSDTYRHRLSYTEPKDHDTVAVMNFLEFAAHFDHHLKKEKVNGELIQRSKPRLRQETIAIRIYEKYSSNPTSDTYGKYCKFQFQYFFPCRNR